MKKDLVKGEKNWRTDPERRGASPSSSLSVTSSFLRLAMEIRATDLIVFLVLWSRPGDVRYGTSRQGREGIAARQKKNELRGSHRGTEKQNNGEAYGVFLSETLAL